MQNPLHYWFSDSALSNKIPNSKQWLHWVTGINDELPIVMSPEEALDPPITFPQLFQSTILKFPLKTALRIKKDNEWVSWTYQEYYNQSVQFAISLISLGITQRKAINIIGFNSPEWLISFCGSLLANCIPVGVYTTSGTESCFYAADHSEAELIVVQNETYLAKYLEVWEKLPKIKAIIVYWPKASLSKWKTDTKLIFTWSEFMELGNNVDPNEIENRIQAIRPTQAATIVYTSGTTGPPKGVLLSHDNYIWCAKRICERFKLDREDEQIISFLPLSHSAAQCFDIFCCIFLGGCLSFADENALQGTIANTVKEVRPTFFFAVPRIWEKFEEKIKEMISSSTPQQKKLIRWAQNVAGKSMISHIENQPLNRSYYLANSIFFEKIRALLGFDRCRVLATGAAPLPQSTFNFFWSIGLHILIGYGMSENAAPMTYCGPGQWALNSAGKPLRGAELKIINSKMEELPIGEIGEICFKGRNKFLGYLKNEVESRKAIDADGFIHSGDEGYVDINGFVYITGRIKELIITAGGEKVPPFIIEEKIKNECNILNTVLVVGEGKKYLAALLSLKYQQLPDGSYSNELSKEILDVLTSIGSAAVDRKSGENCAALRKFIQKAIDKYNKHASTRVHQIKKWGYLPSEFSIAGGEYTPTMKLRRQFASKKYKVDIEKLFTQPNI
ncbi:unnamed protein product [Blepharisma stoltei]|uniref:AMP-dependent synthetase/ligase domain-containing protein n=1 Tax=Blepharisma stoltei TaxID=1481888 RepID=A0AAU9IKB4_9CILI|nr:unnamed protein product [Blepharisma stoltei]